MQPGAPRDPMLGYTAAVAVPAMVVVLLQVLPAITARAAVPLMLVSVLLVARACGSGPGRVAFVMATAGYWYYFVSAAGLAREEQWVALVSFVVSAGLVGELAAHGEQRRREALAGRREIERLYQELQIAFERTSEAEAARRNEQLKAALLDALTHNLRTPLTAIKAAVTALMGKAGHADVSTAAELSKESRRDLLQVIDEESDRLNRFVQGLSAANRRDASQPVKFRSVMVGQIVDAGVTRAQAVTRHHRLIVSVEGRIPSIAVDAPSIIEVIYILLDNASKYSPPDSAIRLTASCRDARYVTIEVADEGPGIAPLLRERVFDKFFRIAGREPSDPHRAGIGLGLPIARQLVDAQGGRIWIEAPPSRHGTAVIMTLPTVARAEPEAMPASSAVSS